MAKVKMKGTLAECIELAEKLGLMPEEIQCVASLYTAGSSGAIPEDNQQEKDDVSLYAAGEYREVAEYMRGGATGAACEQEAIIGHLMLNMHRIIQLMRYDRALALREVCSSKLINEPWADDMLDRLQEKMVIYHQYAVGMAALYSTYMECGKAAQDSARNDLIERIEDCMPLLLAGDRIAAVQCLTQDAGVNLRDAKKMADWLMENQFHEHQ